MAFLSGARVSAARCWLCPRSGNGGESNSRFRFPHFQMVDAGAACVRVFVCWVNSCVCVYVLMQGGRDTLTGAGTASSFLSNSSAHAHLL